MLYARIKVLTLLFQFDFFEYMNVFNFFINLHASLKQWLPPAQRSLYVLKAAFERPQTDLHLLITAKTYFFMCVAYRYVVAYLSS